MKLKDFFYTKRFILVASFVVSGSGIVHAQAVSSNEPLALNTTHEYSKKLSVFPSLTSGVFNIVIDKSITAPVYLSVLDQEKNVVFETVFAENNYSLNLSHQENGVYKLLLTTNKENFTKKLIIK